MWTRTGLEKSEMVMYQQLVMFIFYAVTDDLFTLMQFLGGNEDEYISLYSYFMTLFLDFYY